MRLSLLVLLAALCVGGKCGTSTGTPAQPCANQPDPCATVFGDSLMVQSVWPRDLAIPAKSYARFGDDAIAGSVRVIEQADPAMNDSEVVLAMWGTNDLYTGLCPSDPVDCAADIVANFDTLDLAGPAPLVYLRPPGIYKFDSDPLIAAEQAAFNADLEDLNDAVSATLSTMGVYIVNLRTDFFDPMEPTEQADCFSDDFHPTPACHVLLAAFLDDYLATELGL